jgi:5-methylcytosine-specific restriction enzyme subunit McrC
MNKPRIIELPEYKPIRLLESEVPKTVGEILWRNYNQQVAVDFPSIKTEGKWQLTAKGWAGHIPLTSKLSLVLKPKVELNNLFGMLEYAYRLKSFNFLEGLINCQTLEEFYEQLAHILARRVLDRSRRGFYRTYLNEIDHLPYLRGQLDLQQSLQSPWEVKFKCHYQEHTGDIEENQILGWTLFYIARTGLCTERVLPTIRQAYRTLQGFVTLTPHGPQACIGRLYNRLNDDYQPLHALCRFFLEQSGPSHELGHHTMLPFLVDMPRLYELFVAEWLKSHLPSNLTLKPQEHVYIGQTEGLQFKIDLVLYDVLSEVARCVMDTKYKTPDHPSTEDVSQVATYALAKGCHEAILIYPEPLLHPLDVWFRDVRVRTLTFSLTGNLEEAGEKFLKNLYSP